MPLRRKPMTTRQALIRGFFVSLVSFVSFLFFVVSAGGTACSGLAPRDEPSARNFVLVTIDTLRADHVGAYGYARARTPSLDALAKNGMLFERAFAAAPIT